MYANLYECLQLIIKCFKCNTGSCQLIECAPIVEVQRLLRLYSQETDHLIHQYYVERYEQQMKMNEPTIGQLTIRAHFYDDRFLEVKLTEINMLNFIEMQKSQFKIFI